MDWLSRDTGDRLFTLGWVLIGTVALVGSVASVCAGKVMDAVAGVVVMAIAALWIYMINE